MSDRKLLLEQLFAPAMEILGVKQFSIEQEISAVDSSRKKEHHIHYRIQDSITLGSLPNEILDLVHNGYRPEKIDVLRNMAREQARVEEDKDFFYPLKDTEIGIFQRHCVYHDEKGQLHKSLAALAGAIKEITGIEFERKPYMVLRNTNPDAYEDARDLVYVLPLTQGAMNILQKVQPQVLADMTDIKYKALNSWVSLIRKVPNCPNPSEIQAVDTEYASEFPRMLIEREEENPGSVKRTSGFVQKLEFKEKFGHMPGFERFL